MSTRVILSLVLVMCLVGSASADLVSRYRLDGDETDEMGTNHGDPFVAGGSGTGGFKTSLAPVPSGTTQCIEMCVIAGQGFQRINIPNLSEMGVSAGSVALWARHQTTPEQDTSYLFGGGADGDRLQIYMDGSNRELDVGLGNSHRVTPVGGVATFTDGVWYHVALTWDSGTYEVYVSTYGTVAGNVAYNTGSYLAFDTFGGNAHIGNTGDEPGGHTQAWSGRLDEVRLYSHALSEAQVEALIPEPATIALLGLGGLALLRRKR